MIYRYYLFAYLQIMVVVVKSGIFNNSCFTSHTFPSSAFSSSSPHNTTASHLYMRNNAASLRNSAVWRDKMFVKIVNRSDVSDEKAKSCQGEKEEKGEKEIKKEILDLDPKVTTKNENILSVSLDVDKVINTLSLHLEKIQTAEQKEKMVDKTKGDIVYQTKDGRVLRAFHSCERGKIIWDEIVYDTLKKWLAAASIVAPSRCYD